MKGFSRWKRTESLEHQLRDDRPAPSQGLLDEIVSRIEASRAPSRASAGRLALAGVAAVVMLMMFAAFGGAGFAASGVSGAASSTAKAVSKLVKAEKASTSSSARSNSSNSRRDRGDDDNGNGNGNGNGDDDECEDDDDDGAAEGEYCRPRVTICHVKKNGKEKTLTLRPRAAARHLNNHPRDHRGPCDRRNGDDGDDD